VTVLPDHAPSDRVVAVTGIVEVHRKDALRRITNLDECGFIKFGDEPPITSPTTSAL
jgi:hypothetical protein